MGSQPQRRDEVRRLVLVSALLVWTLAAGTVGLSAHPFEITGVDIVFDDEFVYATLDYHVDAMLAAKPGLQDPNERDYLRLRAMSAEEKESGLRAIGEFLRPRVQLRFDGAEVPAEIDFPAMLAEQAAGAASPLPGQTFRLTAPIPDGAQKFSFAAAPLFNFAHVQVVGPYGGVVFEQVLEAGGLSEEFDFRAKASPPTVLSAASRYVGLGFRHIVPLGWDHVLFVLGLFLASTRVSSLIWQISAFTLAHTVTLGLAAADVVRLPSRPVEILIALSIVYVAVENVRQTEVARSRLALVFGFGLLHGLGFAGVLGELGLPQGRFLPALLGFNVGVELGQLAVVLGAALVCWPLRRLERYRQRVVVPASLLIGAIGLYWVIERLIG